MSAITQACRYEPQVNWIYHELARHYGAVVIPARPYKPRDKANRDGSCAGSRREEFPEIIRRVTSPLGRRSPRRALTA